MSSWQCAGAGAKFLRGGRLTRIGKSVVSFAPMAGRAQFMVSVSAMAVAALGALSGDAWAQNVNCESVNDSDVRFFCPGGAIAISAEQVLNISTRYVGQELVVTVAGDARVNVGTRKAFLLGSSGGIRFTQSGTGQEIRSSENTAIYAGNSSSIITAASGGGSQSAGSNVLLTVTGSAIGGIDASGTLADVSGEGERWRGIYAFNDFVNGGGVTVTAATVTGADDGIDVWIKGTGTASVITTGSVKGHRRHGIRVNSSNSAIVNTSATVTGSATGITAVSGSGTLSISAGDLVTATGTGGMGIYGLVEEDSGQALTITAAAVTGSAAGIKAVSSGTGAVSIQASGEVRGTDADSTGIYGFVSSAGGGGLTITATSAVTGSAVGIDAVASGGAVTVSAAAVTGGTTGIKAVGSGTGAVSIQASGEVRGTGAEGKGIYGLVSAANGGGLSITATSTVTGSAVGIDAVASGGAVTISAAAVTGGTTGIKAVGTAGAVSVSASGEVSASSASGVGIDGMVSSAGALTVTAATVTGGGIGIKAQSTSAGAVIVQATGAVTGTATAGIEARGGANTTGAVTVRAAAVTGAAGIDAQHGGSGAVNVHATGTVTGASGIGIFASGGANVGTITVTAAAVTGGTVGIKAVGSSANAVIVSASEAVSATGATGTGIDGLASGGGSLSITAAAVTGSAIGIKAVSSGAGGVAVRATGAVTGTATAGIRASGSANTTGAVTVSAAAVTGAAGIDAQHGGSGAVNVHATGTVTGASGIGIFASGGANVGTITVTAAAVTGGTVGIKAVGSSANAVIVSASEAVSATGATGTGIDGLASGGGSLSITAAAVTGSSIGIKAVSSGAGTISVRATGEVGGTGTAGVQATGGTATGAMTINVATVTGKTGIDAKQGSANKLDIAASGEVTGTGAGGVGIDALVSSAGALTITAAAVTGSAVGIKAVSSGAGAVSVEATGAVEATGTSGIGIDAAANDGALTITAAAVTGTATGIKVAATGTGNVSISASGEVKGTDEIGIDASAAGGDVTISAAAVTAATTGIKVAATGSGSVSISATGAVTGTGSDGIYVKHGGGGATTITVTTAVTGSTGTNSAAIRTDVSSGGATVALNNGASVGAGTGNAIKGSAGSSTVAVNSGATVSGNIDLGAGADSLTVNSGATVSGNIDLGAGRDSLTVNSGASVSGEIKLGAGDDELTFMGGTLPTVSEIDGGDGSDDKLDFKDVSGNASNVTGWEEVTIESGATISFGTGTHRLTAGTLTVASNGTLDIGDDNDTDDELTVSGNFTGGGTVTLDANFTTRVTDKLMISGNATGTTTVNVSQLGPALTFDSSPERIEDVITVTGNSSANAFQLDGGSFGSVAYILDSKDGGKSFELRRTTENQCRETTSGSGVFVCHGRSPIVDIQTLSASGANALDVTLNSETPVTTSGTDTAFNLTQSGAAGITFTQSATGRAVTGAGSGIVARETGGGAISISVNGTVTGESGVAIDASADGGNVTISAAGAEGSTTGIRVTASGTGVVSVMATGAVMGTGDHGIYVDHDGSGATTIAVSSAVTGGSGTNAAAIKTDVSAGSDVTILLNSGASVGEGAGNAILGGAGDSNVTVDDGAAITGIVSLGAGDDTLTFSGGDFSSATALDGGGGSDTLRFSGGSGSLNPAIVGAGGDGLKGWENVVVQRGATLSGAIILADDSGNLTFDGATIGNVTSLDGGGGGANTLAFNNVSGSLATSALSGWETAIIGAGSRMTLGGSALTSAQARRLSVTGTLAFGSTNSSTDTFTVKGDVAGGGTIAIDANFVGANGSPTADRLIVEGDVAGTITIALNDLTPANRQASSGDVEVVTVSGAAEATAFSLAGGTAFNGAYAYSLEHVPDDSGDGSTFVLRPVERFGAFDALLGTAPRALIAGFAGVPPMSARLASRRAASVGQAVGQLVADDINASDGKLGGKLSLPAKRPPSDDDGVRLMSWASAIDVGDRGWIVARAVREEIEDGPGGSVSEVSVTGFDAGFDAINSESEGGDWTFGLIGRYGTMDLETTLAERTAKMDSSGYGFGGNATWSGTNDIYTDAVAMFGSASSNFASADGAELAADVESTFAVASVEAGKRIDAGDMFETDREVAIIPHARLSRSSVSVDETSIADIGRVDFGSVSNLIVRVGTTAEFALEGGGALRLSGSVSRDVASAYEIDVDGKKIAGPESATWIEIGFGGSMGVGENARLHFDGAYRSGGGSGVGLSGGLSWSW